LNKILVDIFKIIGSNSILLKVLKESFDDLEKILTGYNNNNVFIVFILLESIKYNLRNEF
jgi:hypothetical protein